MTYFLNSPVHLKVKPRIESNKVKVSGNGVSMKGVPASLPTDFLIDTTEAGYGDLEVQVLVSAVIIPFLANPCIDNIFLCCLRVLMVTQEK